MRKYRLIISALVLLTPIAFLMGVLSGQADVKANPSYYQLQTMDRINCQIDYACGDDPYCRDVFVECQGVMIALLIGLSAYICSFLIVFIWAVLKLLISLVRGITRL